MAQMIEMFKNDYLKSSIQKTIDHIKKKDDIKQVKTLKTFENKINEIYEKGCLYKKHYEGIPIICPFKKIFKIPKHVNPVDIVTLFFPLCFIENTPIEKISRPIILEQIPKKGGGSGESVQNLTQDKRRHIYALNIRELAHYEEFNYGRFVMKIALNKNYSQAYDIEGKVYNGMQNRENVVKMYRAGKFDKDNNDFWGKDWEDDNMTIDMNKLLDIDLNIDSITLPTNADKYKNMSFLLLENCYNHQTLRNYVRREKDSSGTRSYEAFKKTMKAVQVLNEKVGFFHGDLHTDNVLIREDGEDVKLFDFDFSALLNNKIISNNLLLYNLTWKPCDGLVNEDCKLFIKKKNEKRTVVILQPGIEKTRFDVKHFAFIFDYFRLLFSILKKRTISNETFSDPTDPEFEKRSKKILLWYNTELDKKKDYDWNDYFEGNVFFPIYNFIQTNFILTEEEFERRYKELEQEVLQGNSILTEEEFERRYKELEQEILPGNFILTEEFERRYKELEQEVLQGNFVKNNSYLSSNFLSSNDGSKGGGNKLKKKYTRLGRAQITKDSKRTSRVIYKSGKGYYIRDVKGIYTLVKKKDVLSFLT